MGAHYNTPQVKRGILHYRMQIHNGTQSLQMIVGADDWFDWLEENHHFNYLGTVGQFTARKETIKNRNRSYWYAYRKINGKLKKEYLGSSDKLTDKKLYDTAKVLNLVAA